MEEKCQSAKEGDDDKVDPQHGLNFVLPKPGPADLYKGGGNSNSSCDKNVGKFEGRKK